MNEHEMFLLLFKQGGISGLLVAIFWFVERIVGKIAFQTRTKEIIITLKRKMDKVHDICAQFDTNGKTELAEIYKATIENKGTLKQVVETLREAAKDMSKTAVLIEKLIDRKGNGKE